MFVYMKGLAMTSSDQEIREHVRDRYAAARVVGGVRVGGELLRTVGRAADELLRPVGRAVAISDTEEGDIFGAALYTPGETDGLPEEAVLASLGCGNPLAVAELREGNGFWTWAPAAGSTCCSPPAGSARPGSPTAWT